MRKYLCLVPLAVLALTACDDNNISVSSNGGSSGGSSSSGSSSGGGASSQELSAFVLNLFASDTTSSALPTDLTTVTLVDTPATEATAYDSLFAPSSSSSSSGG